MAHLEEDIIERAKNTDMIALLESEEGFSFKSTYGEREFKCIEHNSLRSIRECSTTVCI